MANKWKGLDRKGGYWKGMELQKIVCAGKTVWEKAAAIPNDYILAYDLSDNALDASPNANHGMLNDVTFENGYAVFNGVSSRIITSKIIQVNSPSISVAVKIKANNLPRMQGVFDLTSSDVCRSIINDAGPGTIDLYDSSSNGLNLVYSNITTNWISIVFIIDRTKDGQQANSIYINKIKTSSIFGNYSTDIDGNIVANSNATIGALSQYGYPFSGMMKKLRVYNRVLNQSEITQLYNE